MELTEIYFRFELNILFILDPSAVYRSCFLNSVIHISYHISILLRNVDKSSGIKIPCVKTFCYDGTNSMYI